MYSLVISRWPGMFTREEGTCG